MTQKKSRIPEFKTVQEEAEFWDTHHITDFLDELKPVKMKVSRNLSYVAHVRFDDHTLSRLEAIAHKKGMATGTLIRMLVKEGLERASSKPVHP